MNVKQLLGAISAMIIKVALAVVIIVVVFRLAIYAYDFGYQVFADVPVSEGEGRTVSIEVSEEQDGWKLARLLEQKGIIKDAKVFYAIMILSKEDGMEKADDMLQPGTYELSTAMGPVEILDILCTPQSEEESQ